MGKGADGGRVAASADGGRDEPLHPLVDLYRSYERKLFRQCLTQLRNATDAEDAVQETFLRAARHLDQLEEDPAPYLATVARNVCRDEMRRRARCISTGDPDMFGELEVGHPETSTLDRDQLNAAWKRFTQRERQLIGRRFAGFSYDEIAGHLNMTPGALNVALARARKRARQVASVTMAGLLALFSLRRLANRAARSGSGTAVLPSALMTAAAVTCVAVGVAGGSWLSTARGNAAVAAAPTHLSAAPASVAAGAQAAGSDGGAVVDVATQPAAPAPAPSVAPAVGSLASSVIAPGQGATQEDAAFTSVTPSPAYQQDHTVFASGTLANGCGRPTCPVIFSTHDGGTTWQHVPAGGFLGGRLLLPPAYPTDPVIFASGPAGLQRSDDGGVSFRTVVPGPAPAAIDPASAPGAARVFIAAQVPLIYNAGTGTVQAGPALPAGITAPTDVAYVGGRDVVIAANQADPAASTLQDGVVVVCAHEQACHVTLVDASQPVFNLVATPERSGVGTLFVWSTDAVRQSSDMGTTFRALPVPRGGQIQFVAVPQDFATSRRLVVAEQRQTDAGNELLESVNGGSSFAPVAAVSGLAQVTAVDLRLLPDGREIAAASLPTATTGFGIRCSADAGVHWSVSC